MNRIPAVFFGLALTLFAAASAWAQGVYPNKVVKLVVPFAAGGSTDLLARSLAERLSDLWKQPVIVENRPGASGMIGSDAVAKSNPDGYTVLMGTVSTHAVAPSLYPKLPYDVQRSFTPITELVTIASMLSVHPSLPIRTVQEFVAYAKAKPGQLAYGAGAGSAPQMAMEMFTSRAGIKLLHVPYKGSGPVMVDLLGGQLHTAMDVVMTTLPHMQAGRLRTLAITSPKRSPLAPEVPTIAESGYPGYDADVWFGLFAPAGTPPHIVNKISIDSRRVLTEQKMRGKLEAAGFQIVATSPTAFTARLKEDIQRWSKVIKDANIKVEQ